MRHMSVSEPAEPGDKIAETGGPVAPGYDAWLRAKVERALAGAANRDATIPLEQVLRDFKG